MYIIFWNKGTTEHTGINKTINEKIKKNPQMKNKKQPMKKIKTKLQT